jgi:hypothetical protein
MEEKRMFEKIREMMINASDEEIAAFFDGNNLTKKNDMDIELLNERFKKIEERISYLEANSKKPVFTKPGIESLMEDAKAKYPKGTIFKVRDFNFHSPLVYLFTSTGLFEKAEHGIIMTGLRLDVNVYIYYEPNHKWAKIVEKPIYTNSIGQHFYESEKYNDVYWWNKESQSVGCHPSGFVGKRGGIDGTSEIFKTPKDVLEWALQNPEKSGI